MWRLVEAKIKEKFFENNVLESLWRLLAVVGTTAGYIPALAGHTPPLFFARRPELLREFPFCLTQNNRLKPLKAVA